MFNRYRLASPSMSPTLEGGQTFAVISADDFAVNDIVAYAPPRII